MRVLGCRQGRTKVKTGKRPEDFEQFRTFLMYLARTGLPHKIRRVWSASDIVNETLRKAYQAKNRPYGRVEAWLRQILKNVVRDLCRKPEFRHEVVPAIDGINRTSRWMEAFSASQASPTRVVRQDEWERRFEKVLLDLPDDEFEVIRLMRVRRTSLSKIAREMNRPKTTVSRLYRRALARLRKALQESA